MPIESDPARRSIPRPAGAVTLIVARLAQRLDLTAEHPDLPRPLGLVVNRPEGGAHLRVIRRVEE